MYYRISTVLGLAALILSVGVTAQAVPVPVPLDFVGPGANSMNLGASASGTATTTLNGIFSVPFSGTPNPQTDPLGLNPNTITVSSVPDREPVNSTGGLETASVVIESTTWTPTSLSDVNLDLLNGTTLPFALDQIVLETTNLIGGPNITVDIGGTFQQIKFFQGAGSTPVGLGGVYAIPGEIRGVADVNLGVGLFNIFNISTGIGTQEFTTPFTLEGTLGVNTTGPNDANLTFDGVTSGSFALDDLSTTLTLNSFGVLISAGLTVSGGIDLAFDYHLEDTAHIPEPGTFVLLGIGAIGLVPIIRRRLRKS